jgi:hypothetical protein
MIWAFPKMRHASDPELDLGREPREYRFDRSALLIAQIDLCQII